jgi:hypothetical protein
MNRKSFIAIPGLVVLLLSMGLANAVPLIQHGELAYDPELGITMPIDANVANAIGFEQEFGSGGGMVFRDAFRLVQHLNAKSHLGITNWRIPTLFELLYLHRLDGVRRVEGDSTAASPLVNLQPYYWTREGLGFSFYDGQFHQQGAYRFVLPVADIKVKRHPLQPFNPGSYYLFSGRRHFLYPYY